MYTEYVYAYGTIFLSKMRLGTHKDATAFLYWKFERFSRRFDDTNSSEGWVNYIHPL